MLSLGAGWPRDQALVDVCTTGDPNSASAAVWPVFEPDGDAVLLLDEPSAGGIPGLRKDVCDFWDR